MRTSIENYLHFKKNCIRPHYEKLKPLKSGFIENWNDRDPWNRVSVVPSRGDVSLSFWGINGSLTVFPSSSFFQAACYFEHCSHQRESLNFHFHFLKVGSENAYLLKHCSCQEKVFYTSIFFPILEVRMHISLNFVPRRKASTRSAASFNLAAKSWEQFFANFWQNYAAF